MPGSGQPNFGVVARRMQCTEGPLRMARLSQELSHPHMGSLRCLAVLAGFPGMFGASSRAKLKLVNSAT